MLATERWGQERTPAVVLLSIAVAAGVWSPPAHADYRRAVVYPTVRPTVDGQCDLSTEYESALTYGGALFYRPDVDQPAARVLVVHDNFDLFICVRGLPFGTGPTTPFVTVVVDSEYDGGPVPLADDWRLRLDEEGVASLDRGNGLGGFTASGETGWQAAAGWNFPPGGSFPDSWNAEFSFPYSMVGIFDAFRILGLHVRHNWVRFQTDDYGWPATGIWNDPRTWEPMVLMPPATGVSEIGVDVERVSQGLEFDYVISGAESPGVPYELVAGKNTLVRAQLFTRGISTWVSDATCIVDRPGQPDLVVPASGTPHLRPAPAGTFLAGYFFDCWLNGYQLRVPGRYTFSIDVYQGATIRRVRVATETLHPTHDLNLYYWRWENLDSANPLAQSWDLPRIRSLLAATAELERMFPLRSYVRPLPSAPSPIPIGVAFGIAPGVFSCGDGSASGDPCDIPRVEALSEDARRRYDGSVVEALRADTGSRLEAVTSLPVGSVGSCQAGRLTLCGVLHDANLGGSTGTVIAHEIGHSLGLVEHTSPHTTGAWHSTTADILTLPGLPLVNTHSRETREVARSLMNPIVPGIAADGILEGWEWNRARQLLLALPRSEGASPAAPRAPSGPLFHLVGSIDTLDAVSVFYTQRVDDGSLQPSPNPPGATYLLALLDGSGGILATLGFEPSFESPDLPLGSYPIVLTMPLATGAEGFAILHDAQYLYSDVFSAAAPTVSNVVATAVGSSFELSWNSSDPDSPDLRFNIFFDDPNRGPALLASGVTDSPFTVTPDLLPSTPAGAFRVVATDGLQTVGSASALVAIPAEPPIAVIRSPANGTQLLDSLPAHLTGAGFDRDAGPLTGADLEWSSSLQGLLGTGEELAVLLSPGSHVLELRAVGPTQLADTQTVTVDVHADADGDFLSDDYETAHASCLDPAVADAGDDPDADGLPSAGEFEAGTDPCEGDSDLDGFGDDEELRLGGDPLDQNVEPSPPPLFLTPLVVDLGACPSPLSGAVSVQPISPNAAWSANGDADWLEGESSGAGDGVIPVDAACNLVPAGDQVAHIRVAVAGEPVVRTVEVRVFNPYHDPDAQPDCNDGVDNDGDGDADGDDASCLGATDPSEKGTAICDNGVDDDGDGRADFPFDTGCSTAQAAREDPQCQDGIDNDGDSGVDYDGGASHNDGAPYAEADPDCLAASQNLEAIQIPGLGVVGLVVLGALIPLAGRFRSATAALGRRPREPSCRGKIGP